MSNSTEAVLDSAFANQTTPFIRSAIQTPLDSSDVISDTTIEPWLKTFSVVTTPILLVLGLGGNILTLMVSTSRAYRNTAHGLYITAMAVADITFLLTQPFNKSFVHDLFGVDIRAYSPITCKIYYFLLRWARPMSSLVIVLICVERFVAIWFPLKAKVFSSRRAALIEICGIFSLACFVSGFRSQTVGIENGVCLAVVGTEYDERLTALYSVMGVTIRTLIPTCTLLLLTPPIVAKLFYQRRVRRQMRNGKTNQSDETFHVSIMLLSVVIAFCVLVTPFCLAKHGYLLMGTNIVSTSTPSMINLNEVRLICEQFNCVINFILYVLLSRKFRRRFYDILTCQRKRKIARSSTYGNSGKESVQTVSSMVSKE